MYVVIYKFKLKENGIIYQKYIDTISHLLLVHKLDYAILFKIFFFSFSRAVLYLNIRSVLAEHKGTAYNDGK